MSQVLRSVRLASGLPHDVFQQPAKPFFTVHDEEKRMFIKNHRKHAKTGGWREGFD